MDTAGGMAVATADGQSGTGLGVLLLGGAAGLIGLLALAGLLVLARHWQSRSRWARHQTVFGVPVVRTSAREARRGSPPADEVVAIDLRAPAPVAVGATRVDQPSHVSAVPVVEPAVEPALPPAPAEHCPRPQPLPPARLSVSLAHGAPVVRVTAGRYRRHVEVVRVTRALAGSAPTAPSRWTRIVRRRSPLSGREVRHLLRSLYAAREIAVRLAAGGEAEQVRDGVAARYRLPATAVRAVATPGSAVAAARDAYQRLRGTSWARRTR